MKNPAQKALDSMPYWRWVSQHMAAPTANFGDWAIEHEAVIRFALIGLAANAEAVELYGRMSPDSTVKKEKNMDFMTKVAMVEGRIDTTGKENLRVKISPIELVEAERPE